MTITPVDAVLAVAIALDPVRELPGNRGYFVDAMNEAVGAPVGSAWCASFIFYCGSRALGTTAWPLPRTAACDDLLAFARRHGILWATPKRGNVFLVLNPADAHDATHTGFVDAVKESGWTSIEGNSNDTGGREGTAVVRLARGGQDDKRKYVFVDWAGLVK